MNQTSEPSAYDQLIALVKQRGLLASSAAVLAWDQETMMPPAGLEHRGEQLAQLAGLTHKMTVDPRLGELLAACESDGALTADRTSVSAVNLREIRREHDLATKLPQALVEEFTRTAAVSRGKWVEARQGNNFKLFAPWLKKIVELSRRRAECFGWPADGEPWDALGDLFEPGMTAKSIAAVFTPLRQRLVDFVGRLAASPRQPKDVLAGRKFPIDAQSRFVRQIADAMGFDFRRGRLDVSAHPFSSSFHPTDVRITTRYQEVDLADALFSTMHEAGHALYEQGLPPEHHGTPRGDAVSLAIHESQSRLWENFVGRGRDFWAWCAPQVNKAFPGADLDADPLYNTANIVRPSLIRTEADEATYNLHIMIRFELERSLMTGALPVDDLPGAWNARYKEYLGVDVPSDADGCLQDIHWSQGAIGYFPTYTLGNLYAAQFFEQVLADIPGLSTQVSRGDFAPLRNWLGKNIHALGMTYRSCDLCRHVTGKPLSADPLLGHLHAKLEPLYGL